METKLSWKLVWKVLNTVKDPNTLSETLRLMADDLLQGLTKYKSDNTSFDKHAKIIKLEENIKFRKFLKDLCFKLNLDLSHTWSIFCNYIMFDSYHKMEDIREILDNPELTTDLIKSIWHFYGMERMYSLRILEYIIRLHTKNNVFLNFINEYTYKAIQFSLIEQLEYLILEITYKNTSRCIDLNAWVSRNYSEQLQVLVLIAATIEYCGLDIGNFIILLKLFQEHCFMQRFEVSTIKKASDSSVIEDIRYIQFGVFFVGLKEFWYRNELWYPFFDAIELILKDNLHIESNHLIVLAWTVLQNTLPDDLLDSILNRSIFKGCILDGFHDNIFVELQKVVAHPIAKGTLAENIIKLGVADFLEVLYTKFLQDRISFENGILPLAAELLRSKRIAEEFFTGTRNCLKEIYCDHVRLFPSDFESYTLLYEALVDSQCNLENVLSNLCNIRMFSEPSNENDNFSQENLVLQSLWKPFGNDLVQFPVGTKVSYIRTNNTVYRTFHGSYSYFTVLLHLIDRIECQFNKRNCCNETEAKMLIGGYRLMTKLVNISYFSLIRVSNVILILQNVTQCMKAIVNSAEHNIKLLNASFDLVVALFEHYPEQISTELSGTPIFPELCRAVYDEGFLHKNNVFTQFLCIHIYKDRRLLVPFIKLVCKIIQTGKYHFPMQIRGCIIIIGEWYLEIMDMDFIHDNETLEIANEMLNLIYLIMDKDPTSISDIDLLMYNSFVNLFINNEAYLNALLKLIEFGTDQLDFICMINPNIYNTPLLELLNLAEKSFLCLSLLLGYISRESSIENYSLFEERLYRFDAKQKSTLHCILNFMAHGITFKIPNIGCCILTKFVGICDKHIERTLDLNDVLIQDIFLERLRNPLEDYTLKVSIVQFVDECLPQQNCITMALFNPCNVKCDSSMGNYLNDYISSLKLNSNSTSSPMYSAVICLLHGIFQLEKFKLIENVIDMEILWDFITWPLFNSTSTNIEVILQIFELVIIELFMNYTKSEKFNSIVLQMFEESGDFFTKWMQRFTAISKQNPIYLQCGNVKYTLNSACIMIFKRFLSSIKIFHPEYFDRGSIRLSLINVSFDMLVYLSKEGELIYIKHWAEIFNIVISLSPSIYICEEENIYVHIPVILKNFVDGYFKYDDQHKSNILSIILKLFKKHSSYILKGNNFIDGFLKHINWIFFHESNIILGNKVNNMLTQESIKIWMFIISIMNYCLKEDIVEFQYYLLYDMNYLDLVLEIFCFALQNSLPTDILHTVGRTLIVYAESKISHHFLKADLKTFYADIFPPNKYLLHNNNFPTGIIPQHLKDWWTIYPHILHLNKVLLGNGKSEMVDKVLCFLDIHETAICDALKTVACIGDYYSTRMAANVIYFLYEAVSYYRKWIEGSFNRIVLCLTEVLNMSLTVFLRPDVITFIPGTTTEETDMRNMDRFSLLNKANEVPEQNFIDVVNRFLHLATWICLFFIKYNPDLSTLMTKCQLFEFRKFIDNDFRVPGILTNTNRLTYATLICGLQYLCQILVKTSKESTENGEEYFPKPPKYFNVLFMTDGLHGVVDIIKPTEEETEIVPEASQLDWLFHLDKKTVTLCLQAICTFIGVHSFFSIQDLGLQRSILRYIKRELCEELEVLYESVYQYVNNRNLLNSLSGTTDLNREFRLLPTSKYVHINNICTGNSSDSVHITNSDDVYLIAVTHWLRNFCRLVHYRNYDRTLAKWHIRTTCQTDELSYIKPASLLYEQDEFDDF